MSEISEVVPAARASVRRSRRFSAIWAVPVVAIAIAAWLAWDTLSKQGPTIRIDFESAEGLQAGQSQLKFKDITLGTVKSLNLSHDHTRVTATVATTRQATPLLTNETIFWVVKPRLFAGNLSGLGTLLSGSYIGMLPGEGAGRAQRDFVGREDPPVLEENVAGRTFLLKSNRLGSISLGSPVFFRDLKVGEVLGWDVGDMAESVTLHAFVRAPFDQYVRDDSRFWNASGVSVKLTGAGVEMQVESLMAILLGGVAFDTPNEASKSKVSEINHEFPLFADRDEAKAASYSRKIQCLAYFPGSVRGLAAGNDVTLHGLKVGHVIDVRLSYDPVKDAVLAPVRFEVQPERIVGIGKQVYRDPRVGVEELVRRGLRATLVSGNLITGQMLVGLDFESDAPPATLTIEGDDFVIPTGAGGGLGGIEAAAGELLRKVNTIPFDTIGHSLGDLSQRMTELANGPELQQSMKALAATLVGAQDAVQKLNDGLGPAAKKLPDLVASLEKTLTDANRTMLSFETGYGNNTAFYRDIDRLLAQTTDALRSLRALTDLLARHPEALIRGRPGGGVE
jgi:paraquat-inducible protein B